MKRAGTGMARLVLARATTQFGLPSAHSTPKTSTSKEPLSSTWKAQRRHLHVTSCCPCSKQRRNPCRRHYQWSRAGEPVNHDSTR
jgi:hypothetical protein